MSQGLDIRRARGRAAKQGRSERTRSAIVEAVVEVLAEHGVAGLTHRLVAQRSGASLAATTYYFTGKRDMIAAASDALIGDYIGRFAQIVAAAPGGGPTAFRAFVVGLAGQAMSSYRTSTQAWCEIMLDGAHDPETRTLARLWFARAAEIWQRAARAFDLPDAVGGGVSAQDVVLGALFHGLALGFTREQMSAVLTGAEDPAAFLPPPSAGLLREPTVVPISAKAAATRERLLDAAMRLLAERGASAVNYRSVAIEAGLTAGAPAYHFASSEELLAEAEALLFARSRARYQEVMTGGFEGVDLATLAELMAVVFQSEATEFGAANLATYAIWLQAGRAGEMQALVRGAIGDLHRAWSRILMNSQGARSQGSFPEGSAEPLFVQLLFVGALIRVIVCGAKVKDLVEARLQLKRELAAFVEGRHWLQAGGVPAS